MIRLFRNFRTMEPIDRAIDVWAQADALMAQLIEVGERIRADVKSDMLEEGGARQYIDELHRLNLRLTPLEDEFSHLLGVASRKTETCCWRRCLPRLPSCWRWRSPFRAAW